MKFSTIAVLLTAIIGQVIAVPSNDIGELQKRYPETDLVALAERNPTVNIVELLKQKRDAQAPGWQSAPPPATVPPPPSNPTSGDGVPGSDPQPGSGTPPTQPVGNPFINQLILQNRSTLVIAMLTMAIIA